MRKLLGYGIEIPQQIVNVLHPVEIVENQDQSEFVIPQTVIQNPLNESLRWNLSVGFRTHAIMDFMENLVRCCIRRILVDNFCTERIFELVHDVLRSRGLADSRAAMNIQSSFLSMQHVLQIFFQKSLFLFSVYQFGRKLFTEYTVRIHIIISRIGFWF